MKIIYLGTELDNTKEHELFAKEGKCFKLTIIHEKESRITKNHEVEQYIQEETEYTEVHYLYGNNEPTTQYDKNRIAFESHIQQTGFTHEVKEIEKVIIEEMEINDVKYITTTLPYINSNPHIGHALELIQADVLTRYFKWKNGNHSVHFNSGLDEHGLKVYQSAIDNGLTPKEHCDNLAKVWKDFYKLYHIEPDSFYRTSDPKHHKSVQDIWNICIEKGDIYLKEYTAKYCVGCEEFKREIDLEDGKCSTHPNTELETVSEENYFFRLTKYKEELLVWFNDTEQEFLLPSNKRGELKHFLENIEDISVSRDSKKVSWGVPVPNDSTQTIYVWYDALLNYLFSAGYNTDNFNWNDTVQLCGADNIRFQAVIFQGMLCSLGIKNSGKLLVHGTVVDENGIKMSKSLGNVVDPIEQYDRIGLEAVRYYLIAGNPTFSNFGYSEKDAKTLFNAHICNGFGNLTKRVITLLDKKNCKIRNYNNNIPLESNWILESIGKINNHFENYNINLAYTELRKSIDKVNKYLTDTEPWKLSDDEAYPILKGCFDIIQLLIPYYEFIFPNRTDIRICLENRENKILFERIE